MTVLTFPKEGFMPARSDRAPNNYQRKFDIREHAIDRFRERVDEEYRCRSEHDLGNLLDEKLKQAMRRFSVDDPRAPGKLTILVEIETRTSTFYVVTRGIAAITVLDPSMAKTNFAVWTPLDERGNLIAEVQAAPPRLSFTPIDQARLRGDAMPTLFPSSSEIALPSHGSAPEFTLLEKAGLAHARALKRHKDCELAVTRTKQTLVKAEADLEEAKTALATAATELLEAVDA